MSDEPGPFPLSDAEWEYACRYLYFVAYGERQPDAAGFDPARIRVVEQRIRGKFYANRNRFKKRHT